LRDDEQRKCGFGNRESDIERLKKKSLLNGGTIQPAAQRELTQTATDQRLDLSVKLPLQRRIAMSS